MEQSDFPITVEPKGEEICLTQRKDASQASATIRIAAEQIDELCDRLYYARKGVWQRRNDSQRAAEEAADAAPAVAGSAEKTFP